MALYRSPLTVTLWPSSFLKKYGPMIPPSHKAHQTVSFSGYIHQPKELYVASRCHPKIKSGPTVPMKRQSYGSKISSLHITTVTVPQGLYKRHGGVTLLRYRVIIRDHTGHASWMLIWSRKQFSACNSHLVHRALILSSIFGSPYDDKELLYPPPMRIAPLSTAFEEQ
ncbi:hypothetical protein TNCV_1862981 [Trichonephila clavipes]|nr:hypothetical protein TNCV_1862981 [Trichonephila clavipes]